MTDARKALADKIAQIDRLLEREEHDRGYEAFVHIRKIWPELKAAALRPLPGTREEVARMIAQEATACANELYYRYGPKPRDIPRGDAKYVKETIERYLQEVAALPPAPMPEREGMRAALVKRGANAINVLRGPDAEKFTGASYPVRCAMADLIEEMSAAIASHDKTEG